ncbi:MAG TPA: hypothetical protein VFL99_17370 [Segeticoccus sp.]|uniref:hypothetical protein n=1 Tax=Segeticoccus sp. TaxID=2706531 RepID=UPI002D7E3B8F|nr:hypothetical protein [Segeticoccus sp.]HET8602097.1 hypothetical protein [Segeticoccus sp.]
MADQVVLRFPDPRFRADLSTFVGRARSLDEDGAVRLQAVGLTLAAYVGVLPGRGLMGEGAVIGMRAMPLAEPVDCDAVVSLRSVSDRLARRGEDEQQRLAVPPTTVRAGWAALAPPRGGWEPVGTVAAADLEQAARDGIAEVARGTPDGGAGGPAVTALRQAVWGRATGTVPPVPAGGAFAAYSLGFLRGGDVQVFAHGRWTRLTTPAGHVLVR